MQGNGGQWEEKQRYKAEVRSEWDKERDRLIQYRDYLTSTAEGLAGPSSHTQHSRGNRPEADEQVVQWREHRDLDPGPIPVRMEKQAN